MANVYNSQLDAYTLYHRTQEQTSSPLSGPALPALGHALAGSTGTAISNLAIYPLDLIITRLQVQRQLRKSFSEPSPDEYAGVIDAFSQIYHKEGGLSAFYTGVLQDTGKSIADSFLFFLFYNYLRTNRLRKYGDATSLPVLSELGVGALAGACSKFFTTPISNIVTRKQTASLLSSRSPRTPSPEPTVRSIASSIHTEKGLAGFWSGYSASLILTLNPSLTFFLYESLHRLLPRSKRENPGKLITFLIAAISKAVASTTTYPFSLAKARAQTSSSPPVSKSDLSTAKNEVSNIRSEKDAEKTGKDLERAAIRSTVFGMILRIYREEGIEGLYEGVWGEILKGFFSHGITMIVKESIHKLIIQTYYLVLKAMKRFPTPEQLANQAGEVVKDKSEKVGAVVKEGVEKAGEIVKDGYGNGKDVAAAVGERVGVVGNNTSEAAKTANDYASKEAGHLLGNAQEMLGGKIEDLGKGIKPEKE